MKKKLIKIYDDGGPLAGKISAATGAASALVDIIDTGQGPYGAPKAGTAGLKKGLAGAAAGAQLGSMAGPYGTAIGAGVGFLAGGVSGFLGAKREQNIAKFQDERMKKNQLTAAQSQYGARVAADPTLSRGSLSASYFEDGGSLIGKPKPRKPGDPLVAGQTVKRGNVTTTFVPPVTTPQDWGGADYTTRNYLDATTTIDPITGRPRVAPTTMTGSTGIPLTTPIGGVPMLPPTNRAIEYPNALPSGKFMRSAPVSHYAGGGRLESPLGLPLTMTPREQMERVGMGPEYRNNLADMFMASGGGLKRSEDYGSSDTPYPSVDKGDFAGGGRSYPIPTRADAVDALRLAGLHGRSDVRAKVYAKYPDLKKETGGSLADRYMGKY
jgi:hypothetical protein